MGLPAVDLNSAPPLLELVDEAARGGEIVLTRGGEAVAKIVPLRSARPPRVPGLARGLIHMADDFDATPEELKDFF
ncbi:MAG: prevent-host-death protein [Gemmatimonadetes bacterium]|nr:prevent-host-death protein [Gemmatimonadota bacterium]